MASAANNSASSNEDEDNVFSSQFAELLKPIRDLTKQGCWDVNIGGKLEEYVHYIAHLPIAVINVNGEQVKLDFAKAAMVLQNSVHIYSKKVENLWQLLQDVLEFLSGHAGSSTENGEDGQNPAAAAKPRRMRRRQQKGSADLLEGRALKYRKLSSKVKKKASTKEPKKLQTLPYEILQLEEVISNANPVKIKLYTLSNEHLGYPSDLRSNFPFDRLTFFLKIDHPSDPNAAVDLPHRNQDERLETLMEEQGPAQPVPSFDGLDDRPPDLDQDDWQNNNDGPDDGDGNGPPPPEPASESHRTVELPVERNRRLRQRNELEPVEANQKESSVVLNDAWRGMDPYSDDESIKKPCGPPTKCRLPQPLQKERKRKGAGKEPAEKPIARIDEYLGKSHLAGLSNKKPSLARSNQPGSDFWEDFVHFSKTTGSIIKKQVKQQRTEENDADVMDDDESADGEDVRNQGNNPDGGVPDREMPLASPGFGGMNDDDFHFDPITGSPPSSPAPADLDESKQFFQLVQQFMVEYTASAQNFVHSTESTRRVQAWHEMIQPRLLEAESRRDFDIHMYGSRILDAFGARAALGSRTSFAQVIHDQPKNEVARYFLATLQLANTYNVEIGPQGELDVDGIELKLLSRERHHEHMDDFAG